MVTARLFVNSHSTKGSCLPPAKLPFSRRGNGVPGRSLVGTKVPLRLLPEVKSRRTVSPSARVVTNFHHFGVQTGRTCCTPPKHNASIGVGGSHRRSSPAGSQIGRGFAIGLRYTRSHASQAPEGKKGGSSETFVGTTLPPLYIIFLYKYINYNQN